MPKSLEAYMQAGALTSSLRYNTTTSTFAASSAATTTAMTIVPCVYVYCHCGCHSAVTIATTAFRPLLLRRQKGDFDDDHNDNDKKTTVTDNQPVPSATGEASLFAASSASSQQPARWFMFSLVSRRQMLQQTSPWHLKHDAWTHVVHAKRFLHGSRIDCSR